MHVIAIQIKIIYVACIIFLLDSTELSLCYKNNNGVGAVAYAYNPSTVGGQGRQIA